MNYFLEHIAKSLFSEFGNRLNEHCLVFPNRRAGLFFLKYLSREINQPVWTPSIMTINDLFRSFCSLHPAENEILLFELYRVYKKVSKSNESFNDFYYWGDMLLNDFDDIDKNLADASKIFQNIKDIKEIDQAFGGLTEQQTEVVRRFWTNYNPEKMSFQKQEFSKIWSVLYEIYREFRESLKSKNIAYEGMIFRDVIEGRYLEDKSFIKWQMLHFTGFNALNKCEERLMQKLKDLDMARFYWDYDNSYVKERSLNSAGYFLKDNIRKFGDDMPGEWSCETFISKPSPHVRRRIIDTSSDMAQVKLIADLINEIPGLNPDNAHETAIILADENLLVPVLTSLPENISDINITMGYPLKQTLIYSLLRNLFDLQRNAREHEGRILFHHRDVLSLLKNGLILQLTEEGERDLIISEINEQNLLMVQSDRFKASSFLSMVFIKTPSSLQFSGYLKSILTYIASAGAGDASEKNIRNEFIYRVVLAINRLDVVAASPGLNLTLNTWINLLERLLRSQSVPFSGEPLSGIQIMGILETRTLDFRNLIILSVNEGILPASTSNASFIPFSLREAFGLPSINHRESVYAYHFYRLLQRAENVTFLYNSNSEGLRSGEMSRFLQQMKYEPDLKPDILSLGFEIRNKVGISEILERTDEHQNQLMSRFIKDENKHFLSPSAINTWLNCRMRFYYRYVCGMKEPDEVKTETDPAVLGSVLHLALQRFYERHIGNTVDEGYLSKILDDKRYIMNLVNNSIKNYFSRKLEAVLTGNELIVRDVLAEYITRILRIDKSMAPFSILALEKMVTFGVDINVDNFTGTILTGGIIDRVDEKDGTVRILDYKTGAVEEDITSVEEIFKDDRKKKYDGWLQTLLYCEGYLVENKNVRVRPAVYKVKSTFNEDILKIKMQRNTESLVLDYEDVRKTFMEYLNLTVRTIFNRNEPFIMTCDNYYKCSWCPYRILCLR